jgi:serine/threonine-protein kinase
VRKIDPSGTISTVAGVCGTPGSTGDGGPAEAALLKRPYGLELVGDTLYIADTGNNQIRKIILK